MINKVLLISILILLITSCEKEDTDIDICLSLWKVQKIKKDGDIFFDKVSGNYVLSFNNDLTYSFRMITNDCNGHYEIKNKGEIEISSGMCSLVGGEPDFSGELFEMILNMKEYYSEKDRLILSGNGEVILEIY